MTALEWMQACIDNTAPDNVRYAPVDLVRVAALMIAHEESRDDDTFDSLLEALGAATAAPSALDLDLRAGGAASPRGEGKQ
jgi:hypothetical protein